MKTSPALSLAFCMLMLSIAQNLSAQWSNLSLTHGATTRSYRLYTPAIYNPSVPAAVVITLHGLGDNMNNFSLIGMDAIADTANFFILVPQALPDPLAGNAWNSGAGISGFYPNSGVNDIGFLMALLDTVSTHFNINPAKIYACGFSMGGFMTQRLACEAHHRFAAFASVAGTRGSGISACNPGRAIPIAHFHGTADSTVFYAGNTFGNDAEDLVNFWVTHNQCPPTPIHTPIPDIANDGLTVDHYLYPNGQEGSSVEFFKINNAAHTWLFSPINDISYSLEIWKFFLKHSHQNVAISNADLLQSDALLVYPNPSGQAFKIANQQGARIRIYSLSGILCFEDHILSPNYEIHPESIGLNKGLYILQAEFEGKRSIAKIVYN
jgi:polyhydroxybutyrate depolymerase